MTTTITVTGTVLTPAGQPAADVSVRLVPTPVRVLEPSTGTFVYGSAEATTNDAGVFSMPVVPADAPGLDPAGWTYRVLIKGEGVADGFDVVLPADQTTVQLAELTPADPSTGAFRVIEGPPGTTDYNALTNTPPPVPPTPPPAPSPVVASFTSASTTVATTNSDTTWTSLGLSITFVVPPSSRVLLSLEAAAQQNATGTHRWSIADAAGRFAATPVVAIAGSAAGNPVQRRTVTIEVSTDSTGAALVPGKVVTWTWQQACTTNGVTASTQWGGSTGVAVMRVEPVSDRVTDRPMTGAVTTAAAHVPLWLCHDRQTVLGASTLSPLFAWSTDDGATWTEHAQSFAGGVGRAIETDDGEVLLIVGPVPGTTAGTAWRSSGWSASKNGATFTKVLTASGGGANESPLLQLGASWGVSVYGPFILVNEYGPKSGVGHMADNCWLSEDYGQTWRAVFTLSAWATAQGVADLTELHMHSVSYDPWWDAIWISHGDQSTTLKQQVVSFDRGATWHQIDLLHQMTSVVTMPNCILWVTDHGSPNGIYRTPRLSTGKLTQQLAYQANNRADISIIGAMTWRSPDVADPATLIACQSGGLATDVSRLYATYDGYTFREIWTDTVQAANQGFRTIMGPTVTGKYLGTLKRADNTQDMLTLTVG